MTTPPIVEMLDAQIAAPRNDIQGSTIPERGARAGEIRVMDPTGNIQYVPEENLAAALEAGATVLTPDRMRELRQEVFMQHLSFQDKHAVPKKRKRRSIVKGGRR